MRIIPVLDLMGGVAVHARRGERAGYRPVNSRMAPGTADPLRLAQAFRQAGFDELYVADLDAIMRTGNHLKAVTAMVAPDITPNRSGEPRVLVDCGIITATDAAPWLAAGLTVIVGTETLADPADLAQLIDLAGPERVVLSIDLQAGAVVAANVRWAAATAAVVLAEAAQLGIRTAVLLELTAVGMAGGPPLAVIRQLAESTPEIALLSGGGVRNHADLEDLRRAGAAGALVGSALHNGTLSVPISRRS